MIVGEAPNFKIGQKNCCNCRWSTYVEDDFKCIKHGITWTDGSMESSECVCDQWRHNEYGARA